MYISFPQLKSYINIKDHNQYHQWWWSDGCGLFWVFKVGIFRIENLLLQPHLGRRVGNISSPGELASTPSLLWRSIHSSPRLSVLPHLPRFPIPLLPLFPIPTVLLHLSSNSTFWTPISDCKSVNMLEDLPSIYIGGEERWRFFIGLRPSDKNNQTSSKIVNEGQQRRNFITTKKMKDNNVILQDKILLFLF